MNENLDIGGMELSPSANEAIIDISHNRTLFVEKLTNQLPQKPEIVKGLSNLVQVFDHFKPSVNIEFTDGCGRNIHEKLDFHQLGDFDIKGIVAQSSFLNDLSSEKTQFLRMMMQLKTNKLLVAALEDNESRQAILESLAAMLRDLER
ncbi:hypothetical protein DVR12_07495 [Chitinophaga silvatica]|uniref:Uncharacterized protein n=1 Tax=Chitinophaga silvatica TaxID=2282649 RepID=A0A3E1YET5_9BACT|nr:hypothetical protein [Chitinophaga silvatica]RFS25021.1 hypothetical protein DVR12_07495 [Chitinophaga silvatica]